MDVELAAVDNNRDRRSDRSQTKLTDAQIMAVFAGKTFEFRSTMDGELIVFKSVGCPDAVLEQVQFAHAWNAAIEHEL